MASTGEAKEKIAKAVGASRRTLDKATAVVEAAEHEPEKFGYRPKREPRPKRVMEPPSRYWRKSRAE